MGRRTRSLPASAATLGALLLLAPVAGAEGGGTAYPPAAATDSGGAIYGAPLTPAAPPQPVARVFSVAPRTVVAPRLPTVRFAVDQPSTSTVAASVVFSPVRSGKSVRVDLGRVRARKVITVRWPKGLRVPAGRYVLRLDVQGRGGQPLARGAGLSGRANVVVKAKATPKPKPTPAPTPAPVPSPPTSGTTTGIFPVRGAHTYGDRFGVQRSGYTHQGQDVLAAEGTPIVAPVAGSIASVDYQASAAGWYVVQNADDGRAFFYAHCVAGSVTVKSGQRVSPGTHLCDVGSTGDATGPHLHFEIWLHGWRTSAASTPIDPLPQLQAWDR
jgi:murein DD-endopeptidase MepM/ murein hydrolase activator NlpD